MSTLNQYVGTGATCLEKERMQISAAVPPQPLKLQSKALLKETTESTLKVSQFTYDHNTRASTASIT